jgi:phospholipid transport system substrate-binding protein
VRRLDRTGAALTVLTLASSLAISSVAWAGAPTDTMRDFFGAVNAVLTDPRTEDEPLQRLRAIRRHVDEVFDFREAAIIALGREWSARTALEQNEFVVLFADLLERSFVWRLAGKAVLDGGVKVHYVTETVEGETATVDTAVTARDGNDLRLEYRMAHRVDRWVVRDVVLNGVSTMANYHAQFQRVVRDSSWRDLMTQLRAKVGAPPVQVAAAPPAPGPGQRPAAIGPPRPVSVEHQPTMPDVAPVATPGLAVRDVAPLPPRRPPVPAAPDLRASPLPPPTAGPPRTTRVAQSLGDALPMTAAVPALPVERSRAPDRVVADAASASPAYWIQVGAYRNATMAGRVAERVKGEILVVPSSAAGDPLLRVRVGPFPSRAQAFARLREYRSLGYKPFVAAD